MGRLRMLDLDDIFLLLIRDAAEVPHHWLNRWAHSYPLAQEVVVSADEGAEVWQQKVAQAFADIPNDVMVVAHAAGCNAFAAWLFHAGVDVQRRIRGAILAAPFQPAWPDDPANPLNRIRVNFRTALVVGENDPLSPSEWAQGIARHMGAKYLVTPHQGHLNQPLHGWQWGMKLMQDILLD